jgi:hypothetical protein
VRAAEQNAEILPPTTVKIKDNVWREMFAIDLKKPFGYNAVIFSFLDRQGRMSIPVRQNQSF